MKKNIILLVFVLLTSVNYTNGVNWYNTQQVWKVIETTKNSWVVWKKQTRTVSSKKNEETKKNLKVTKKDLKEEIKKRKKYHKSLLTIYNESFDQKYLDLIAFNSQRISDLKNIL